MIDVPKVLADDLAAGVLRAVEVWELELDGGTKRYAPGALTWGGNPYEALAISRDPILETFDFRASTTVLRFSNVQDDLRGELLPADNLTGRRVTIRLLFRDSGGVLRTESLVLFPGVVDRVLDIGPRSFSVALVDLLDIADVLSPYRRTDPSCSWIFADGVECTYTQTTTASGAGSSSTALTVADATNLREGRSIKIGAAGSPVLIQTIAGNAVTLAAARSWADSDPVIYTDCTREFADCVLRAQNRRFGGFAGSETIGRTTVLLTPGNLP